jgi:iduronate 2-sulfatase
MKRHPYASTLLKKSTGVSRLRNISGALVSCLLAQLIHAEPLNILFIGIDDLRPELYCYGAKHIHSPHIDRLAKEGVLFEKAYCQWAVCMPSRASLLSGLRPDSFKGKANAFRKMVPDVVTLPQHFKNHGYFTQSFGKIYHGAWKTAYVGDSFQDPISWSEERWASSPQYYFSPEGVSIARDVFANSNDQFLRKIQRDPNNNEQWKDHFVRGLPFERPDVPDDVPADGLITNAALERLRKLQKNSDSPPFFLAVGFCKPHLPFVAPKKYWDLYDPEKLPPVKITEPPKGAPEFAIQVGAAEVNQYVRENRGPASPEETKQLRHGYAACVSYIDAQVGRLLDELDSNGIRDKTIVVLWSDHGYKLGDFGSWAKHTNFEIDTRVPLIISAPGLAKNSKCDSVVELVDLHPTLSELAGLPVHAGVEGESFAENVANPSTPGQKTAFSQYPRGGYMGYTVRTATHRYTEWHNPKEEVRVVARELYKYGEASLESENLADMAAFRDVQKELQEILANRK